MKAKLKPLEIEWERMSQKERRRHIGQGTDGHGHDRCRPRSGVRFGKGAELV